MKQETRISLFRNYFNPDPVADMTIKQFCDNVQNSQKYAEKINVLRNPKIKKAERDKIKATLPAVTCSGLFTKRNASNLIQHSGFICLDFDAGKNSKVSNWSKFRDNLMRCQNIYFAALSASSQGVFALVPVAYPDQHAKHAKQLLDDITIAMGIYPDKSCSDVSRLRGISLDPDAKFNHEAISYYNLYQEKEINDFVQSGKTSRQDPYEIARKMIKGAEVGERHNTILRAARLLGGFISSGQINESEATSYLQFQARNILPSERLREANKTIKDGLSYGKQNPIH